MKSDEAFEAEQRMEAKLAEAGLDQLRSVRPSTTAPEDPGTPVETVQADQPRNELGQFAATDDPEQNEVAPEPEAEAEPEQVTDDPAVAAYLQKYGGDVNKAIAAAVHAQRQLGKQSTEVGELRAENAQYEALIGELQGLRSDMQQDRARQPLDQATVDWFDEQAIENPYGAAEYARQQGNNLLLQRALATWKDVDPYGAAVYTNQLQNQELQQQMEERLTKVQQLPMDATVHMALSNVQARHPEFSNYGDAFASALGSNPDLQEIIEVAANAGDTAKLERAIETVYSLAQGDTLRQLALTGPAPDNVTTSTEVAAPTISEPHEAPPPKTGDQLFRESFNKEAEQRRRGVFVAE